MAKRYSIYNKKKSKKRKWIQKAVKKLGALSRQLNIPKEKNIPTTLLKKINSAKVGTTIKNPTKTGRRKIKVTRKLKWRASLALRLKNYKRARRNPSKRKKKKRR